MKIKPACRSAIVTVALATAVVLTVASTTAASASEAEEAESPTGVAVALEGLRNLDPTLILPSAADVGQEVVDKLIPVGSGAVGVPGTPESGVELVGWAGDSLTIGLPFADQAEQAVGLENGAVVFPGLDSSSTVVGSIALVISSAWAKDANGVDIPTSFEVDGTTLTQVVSHTEADTAYPVVADPIFIAPWVFRCLLGLGLNGPQITAAFASGTIGGGLGRAALACALGR